MPIATIRIKIENLAAHQKRLAEHFMPAMKRGLVSAAMRCLPVLQEATRDANAVDTGNYLRGWKSEPTPIGARAWNDAPYSGVIELGRRPGSRMPPVQAIANWLQRKRGLSRREAQAAAFAVAKSIAKRGTPGRMVLQNTLPKLGLIAEEEVVRELEATLVQP